MEKETGTTDVCFGWYRRIRCLECALWIVLLVLFVSIEVAATLLLVHPNTCDVKLARLNLTDVCSSHCATMFIRRG